MEAIKIYTVNEKDKKEHVKETDVQFYLQSVIDF